MARAVRHRPAGGVAIATDKPPDTIPERIAKYVPAEVLAFYIPAVTQFGDSRARMWVLFVVALVGTLAYLLLGRDEGTQWFFYPLAAVAFFAWAVGTLEPVADMFGMTALTGQFVLTLAVFVIPLVDVLLERALVGQ